ncbi:MAG: hypothetical protein NTX81_10630, partial [Candidatus Bathyarchaeota archaeon]|nr:hypothetical protein [Candidatus Bathyarchaeota archaeon]
KLNRIDWTVGVIETNSAFYAFVPVNMRFPVFAERNRSGGTVRHTSGTSDARIGDYQASFTYSLTLSDVRIRN